MLDPNLNKDEIGDNEIIEEFNNPQKYGQARLYSIMAKRANENDQIKDYLFEVIKDKKKRNEFFAGAIIHAWLPALHILQNSNDSVKQELKSVISENWDKEEKRLFLNYIEKEHDFYTLLKDI